MKVEMMIYERLGVFFEDIMIDFRRSDVYEDLNEAQLGVFYKCLNSVNIHNFDLLFVKACLYYTYCVAGFHDTYYIYNSKETAFRFNKLTIHLATLPNSPLF